MKYNEKLKRIRTNLGMTQVRMAERLATKQTSISQYEAGNTYPCIRVCKLYLELARQAKVNLTIEELLRE
jgi:transcriptional regulator with XRE-family HTH domain